MNVLFLVCTSDLYVIATTIPTNLFQKKIRKYIIYYLPIKDSQINNPNGQIDPCLLLEP